MAAVPLAPAQDTTSGANAVDELPSDGGSGGTGAVVEPISPSDAGAEVPAPGGDGTLEPTPLRPTTVWLAGDSTVQTYVAGNMQGANGTELEGWGQEFAPFFSPLVTVNNQAIGGRSVAFYLNAVVRDAAGVYQCIDDQGNPLYQLDAAGNRIDNTQWARVKAGITAGDFLLIQFGTNDETHDCPRFVSLEDFQIDLGIMAETVRAKGATPIFVTPMSHRSFVGAAVNNTLLPYANAMKDEASKKSVEVEDLNLRSVEYYTSVGNTYLASNIFDGGTTHFIKAGAVKMAELLVGEIRKNKGPLAGYLK